MRCLTDCFLLQILSNRETLSWPGGGGVLLGVLVGVVPPGSPDPDPISDQKNVLFHTRFQTRPRKSIPETICYHYLDWRADKKILQIHMI